MQSLDTDLRSTLESTVEDAREVAETGANAALNQLGVGDREKPDYLDEEQAELRRRLRARGRQLGDELKNSGEQETWHLAREIAYEHWHRMLFARFLAENDLLVHPELDVAVTLEDCEALADEEGARDGFELAARFATGMLPQIFREDDPVLDLEMAPEHRSKLKRMVQDLPEAVFEADDSLGWVYQFWQSKRKDEVNASGDKIGADELPAVTQLFTEHYMVQFLLDNTLGAWWTARHPDADIDLDFEYLRFVKDEETGEEVPAAGTFDGWPDTAAELTVMDPCMGSGHFLVAALPMLARMRIHEEGLSAEAAVDRVIAENLHGLEIDERCTQIAAFALAMAAWTFNGASGYRELPEMNLACSGLAPQGDLEDWVMLAGEDERLQNSMRQIYDTFENAPTLGSLIAPDESDNLVHTATSKEVRPLLQEALANEQSAEVIERGVKAFGIAEAADMLTSTYCLAATNVPYLHKSYYSNVLKNYVSQNHSLSDENISTVFLERILQMTEAGGSTALVMPQNFLFLGRYSKIRANLLNNYEINSVVWLGPNSFETISGEVVNASNIILSNRKRNKKITAIDAQKKDSIEEKLNYMKKGRLKKIEQEEMSNNVDSRIIPDVTGDRELLKKYASSLGGITSGDSPRFRKKFWEIDLEIGTWVRQQGPPESTQEFSGRKNVLLWEEGEKEIKKYAEKGKATIAGEEAWGKDGVCVRYTSSLPVTIYKGEIYENTSAVIVPYKEKNLEAIWCFCESEKFEEEVRKIDKKWGVTCNTLAKIPFDLSYWGQVAEKKYPDGLPNPYSDDPTQWIFHGHPKPSERPLQVAVARLLGYRWPAEEDEDMELSDEAREWIERCEDLDEHVDDDGIVCIPAVSGERAAADRIHDLLAAAYGDDWGEDVLQDLLDEWGYRSGGLEGWLDGATARQKGKFAQQHNKLFGHRPFIWHVSDEHADGFSALVNYHQLDRANLERLTYTYLGDWIKQQEAAMERGDDGAEARLLAAQDLQEELKKIIEGEPPYDIFVRWKEAHEQPIGWDPDLNDGVLLNIKPFIEAGILRDEPNVRYTKDRGKNPEGAPWGPKRYNRYEDVPEEYKLTDEDGEVIEHLTNEVKRRVRAERASQDSQ